MAEDTQAACASTLSPASLKPIRKTPPPPKLNLDDCRSIVTPTTASTSTNASSSSGTAFVFTSRTIRSLHGRSQSIKDAQQHPHSASDTVSTPGSSVPSIPSTPSPTSSGRIFGKPNLTHALLARHSHGAVDARYIVSPNMRAAGFVPLAYTPSAQPRTPVSPASISPAPTPIDPPPFPPIVFVSPASVMTTPMWDYQRNLDYSLTKPMSSSASSVRSVSVSPSEHAGTPAKPSVSSHGAASEMSSPMSALTPSTSSRTPISQESSQLSIFSVLSEASSRTSLPSIASPVAQGKARERAADMDQSAEAPADGYPFPNTPVRATRHVPLTFYASSSVGGLEAVSNAPSTAGSTASGSVTPLAPSPSSSVSSLPRSSISMSGSSSSGSGSLSPLPLRTLARRPRTLVPKPKEQKEASSSRNNGMSLTELCSLSPRAWVSDVGMLPPYGGTAARTQAARGRTRTASTRSSSSRSTSEARNDGEEARSAVEATEKIVLLDVPAAIEEEPAEENPSEVQLEVKEPATIKVTPLLPPVELIGEVVDEVQLEKEKIKGKERHRGREKDRDRDREKEREKGERRRQKGKAKKSSSHSSSQVSTNTTPSPTREGKQKEKEHGSRKGSRKDRTRSTKEKALGFASSAYSSFSFPPRSSKSKHAHTLGDLDASLEHERAREAAEQAKGLVLAHLERDRQHARETEQWSVAKPHKVSGPLFLSSIASCAVRMALRDPEACARLSFRHGDAHDYSRLGAFITSDDIGSCSRRSGRW